jgi:hypothetical protein
MPAGIFVDPDIRTVKALVLVVSSKYEIVLWPGQIYAA